MSYALWKKGFKYLQQVSVNVGARSPSTAEMR